MLDGNDASTTHVSISLFWCLAGWFLTFSAAFLFGKRRPFAGYVPIASIFACASVFTRAKGPTPSLFEPDGGSLVVTFIFDAVLCVAFLVWVSLVLSLPFFVVRKLFSPGIKSQLRWQSAVIWIVPFCLACRTVDHPGTATKTLISTCFDPPLLGVARLSRVFEHRLLGPFQTEIDDEIVVGSMPMASDVEYLHSKGIVGVVNMCKEWAGPQDEYAQYGIQQVRLPTVDTVSPSTDDLERGVRFIGEILKKKKESGLVTGKVYIHCKGGIGRAATMSLAWYVSKGHTIDEAFKLVKSKRSIISARVKTYKALQEFEKRRGSKRRL